MAYTKVPKGAVLLDQTNQQSIDNGQLIFLDGIKLGTNPTVGTFENGKMFYNSTSKSLDVMIGDEVVANLPQEELCLCYNGTGTDIPNGRMVYQIGAQNEIPSVALAKADNANTAYPIGMATQDIPNGGNGFVTVRGIIHDVNTLGFTEGDSLYLSPTIGGGYTNVMPTDETYFVVIIGTVLAVNATTGSVYVRQVLNNRLNDLLDVSVLSPSVDQVLTWNGNEWINGNQRSIGAGAGISFYLDSTKVIPVGSPAQSAGLESLNKSPIAVIEGYDSVTVNNSTLPIDRYIYNTALGRTKIDAGAWVFNTFGYVDVAGGVSSIPVTVYKVITGAGTLAITGTGTSRTLTISGGNPFVAGDYNSDITLTGWIQTPNAVLKISGYTSSSQVTVTTLSTYINESTVAYSTHRFLFTDANTEVNDVSVGLVTSKTVQPEFTIGLTDKLAVCYFGRTTATSNRTLYLYHGGTTNYSYFETPLAPMHNEIGGLQGGTSDQYYHLSSAKYTDLQNTTGTNTGDLTLGTANGLGLSGQQLSLQAASGSQGGALTAANWITFNGKQDPLGYTPVNKAGDTINGNLAITGYTTITGLRKTPVIKTSAYTLTVNDSDVTGNSSTPFPIYLPPASGTGAIYNITNVGSGIVTLTCDNSGIPDLLNGDAFQALEQGDSLTVKDEFTNIWIIQ